MVVTRDLSFSERNDPFSPCVFSHRSDDVWPGSDEQLLLSTFVDDDQICVRYQAGSNPNLTTKRTSVEHGGFVPLGDNLAEFNVS